MPVLIDTSFLLASAYSKDAQHPKARAARRDMKDEMIVPVPVMFELFNMITARMSYLQAVQSFEAVRIAFTLQALTESDMTRMTEIMRQYQDAEFDFADAAIMALSERLNITEIYTFDHRDFRMFRPQHCAALNLLP